MKTGSPGGSSREARAEDISVVCGRIREFVLSAFPFRYKLHACHYRLVKPWWSIAEDYRRLIEHTFTYTRAIDTTCSD